MSYCIITRDDLKSKSITKELKSKIIDKYDEKKPKYVIAVGGDGTLLRAFHLYPKSIIFGLHTGHLGFYSNYLVKDVDIIAKQINENNYNVEEIDLIDVEFVDGFDNVYHDNALNEVTIIGPTRTLRLDLYIGNKFFERFRGTGFCISTPTGSTAYNKSLNGSVIDPSVKCIQLTEIAAINSNAYRTISSPMILGIDKTIELKADLEHNYNAFVTVDDKPYSLASFKQMKVSSSKNKLKMAYYNRQDFLDRISRTFLNENN